MKFVQVEDLRMGMRLARPIYSKQGVLLFDRDTQLSSAAIDSVKNFGLLGIYILEPAEPLPPMSEEDREFERFQMMMVASIQDEINTILRMKRQKNSSNITEQIIKNYGHLEGKINFYQNLRSRDDFVFRHALNVAMLCAMITHELNVPLEEQRNTIMAALVHDMGKVGSKNPAVFGDTTDPKWIPQMYVEMFGAYDTLEMAFASNGSALKRICSQAMHAQQSVDAGNPITMKMVMGAKILLVANKYDEMTAMSLNGESVSEVHAIKEFLDNKDAYDPDVVSALISSINILFPGVSVELSTGEKALVINENPFNMLKPTVLSFRDNTILDLSLYSNNDIYVVDIMKTLDNRYIMNTDMLGAMGG